MQLSPHQTERFYRIWFALFHFVNEQRQLVPRLPDVPTEGSISPPDAFKLRNALWADETLRERFIATNPVGLPAADLAVVESWRYRLAGTFFIVRHLKKFSVFLVDQPLEHAYGVLGLVSPIEEIVGPVLPLLVQAVLLPFEGQIIYDSLLQPYTVTFGANIRHRLNETYRTIQEREGITTTLEPTNVPINLDEVRGTVLARNAKILNAFRRDLARRGLSTNMVEQHASNIENFAQKWLLAQDIPRGLLDMKLADVQTYLDSPGNKANTTSFKRFVRFLIETGRVDYEQAVPMRDFLQHVRA
ncbi:MAG: hypothetical protein E6I90_07465 [Chloroflexi bacterium]|nr:MAG: hypothetical protein E6I90_07465 [Chloroflexota bacterium]